MSGVGFGLIKCAEKQIDMSDWEKVPLLAGRDISQRVLSDPRSGITRRELAKAQLKRTILGALIGGAGGAGIGALISRGGLAHGAMLGGSGGALIGTIMGGYKNRDILRRHGIDASVWNPYRRMRVSPEVKKRYGEGLDIGGDHYL